MGDNPKKHLDRVKEKRDGAYKGYFDEASGLRDQYTELRDRCNQEIALINSERSRMYDDLDVLYKCLRTVSPNIGRKVTPFDYEMENLKNFRSDRPFLDKVPDPAIELSNWNWFLSSPKTDRDNERVIENFDAAVSKKLLEYSKDITDRKSMNRVLADAVEIAKIYRVTVITVSHTIRKRIVPEMDLIVSFLYADAIREAVIEGDKADYIKPNSIDEYEGSAQDIHYQFVKNAYDFYNLAKNFFTTSVLSNLLSGTKVSKEDQDSLKEQKRQIEGSARTIEKYCKGTEE